MSLSSTLRALVAGDHAWFVGIPDHPECPLWLSRWADDPVGATLQEQVGAIDPALPRTAGVATVQDDGRIRLSSGAVLLRQLPRLAAWVHSRVEVEPELAILKDAYFEVLSADGERLRIVEDRRAWAELPMVAVPGTLGEAAAELEGGDVVQLVLVQRGLLADTDAERLRSRVAGLLRRHPGPRFAGLFDPQRNTLTMQPVDGWKVILDDLLARYGSQYPALMKLAAAQPTELPVVTFSLPSGPDLSAQEAALAQVTAEKPVFFWFTQEDAGGAPMLYLHPDLEGVKALASEGGGAPLARGQVFGSAAGWLDFRVRADVPGLLPALIDWVGRHRSPGLARLAGARVTVRDTAGKILLGHRDDAGWSTLSLEN